MNWGFWFAQVEFTALGGRYERFINLCNEKGIPLSQISPLPGGVQAVIPARYYHRAAGIARSCQTRLSVQERQGMWFRLGWLHRRWGILVGAVLFCVSCHLFGKTVWSIRWQEDLSWEQRQSLRQGLYSMDICEGTILSQETLRQSEKILLSEYPEFAWVALNLNRGRLVVEAMPANPVPEIENNEAGDLLAKADGLILSMNVQEGVAAKQAGQTVAEGEVLVQGWHTDENGTHIQAHAHAKAEVMGQIQRSYRCEQPMEYTALVAQQGMEQQSRLYAFGRYWGKEPAQQAQAAERIIRTPVNILGFALPATVEQRILLPRQQQQISLTEQQAVDYARMACMQQLYAQFPDASSLEYQEEWTLEQGMLLYTMHTSFQADLVIRNNPTGSV